MNIFPLTPFELTLLVVGLLLIGYTIISLVRYGRKS